MTRHSALRRLFLSTTIAATVGMLALTGYLLWPVLRVQRLIHRFQEDEVFNHVSVAEELAEIGAQARAAVPALRAAMKDGEPHLRVAAAFALCRIGEERESAFATLRDGLANGPPADNYSLCFLRCWPSVEQRASQYIRQLGVQARPYLVKALRSEHANARAWAAEILGGMGTEAWPAEDSLIQALADAETLVRVTAAVALLHIDRRPELTFPVLVDTLKEPGDNEHFDRILIHELGPDAVPLLVLALSNREPRIRASAAAALEDFTQHAELVVPALTEALADQDEHVRLQAALALSHYPEGTAAVPALLAALKGEDDDERVMAAAALGRVGPVVEEVTQALVEALKDQDSCVRANAASSLGQIGSAGGTVVPALVGALQDTTHSVRKSAASALGRLGPSASVAVPALRKASSHDTYPEVRRAAAESLTSVAVNTLAER